MREIKHLIRYVEDREGLHILGMPLTSKERIKLYLGSGCKTIGDYVEEELKGLRFNNISIKGRSMKLLSHNLYVKYDLLEGKIIDYRVDMEKKESEIPNLSRFLDKSETLRDFYNNFYRAKQLLDIDYLSWTDSDYMILNKMFPFLSISYDIDNVQYDYGKERLSLDVTFTGNVDNNSERIHDEDIIMGFVINLRYFFFAPGNPMTMSRETDNFEIEDYKFRNIDVGHNFDTMMKLYTDILGKKAYERILQETKSSL